MKLKKWLAASAICALALAVGACGGKKAQKASGEWKPNKDIKVIVAYKAGSGTDTGARVLCKDAEKFVGKTLIIETNPALTERSAGRNCQKPNRTATPSASSTCPPTPPCSGQECFLR